MQMHYLEKHYLNQPHEGLLSMVSAASSTWFFQILLGVTFQSIPRRKLCSLYLNLLIK